jgi:hypothetical protein
MTRDMSARRTTWPGHASRRLLDSLEAVARDQFSGTVDGAFVTVLYTGRRP